MAGGGVGGTFWGRSPEELRDQVRRSEESISGAAFEAQLSRELGELLAAFNGRDINLVQNRLNDLKEALEGEIDGTFDQLFGGSVAKHTYVDGLSDIDSLVIINDTGLEGKSPQVALAHMVKIISGELGNTASVTSGQMAVSVEYKDGMLIQLLPSIRTTNDRLLVPAARGNDWSQINPEAFKNALTKRNQECGGKLIPTIKLAKAINGLLPDAQQLTGYHMESLGIAAFRAYTGEKTTAAMLPFFFERARQLVLSPIRDSTGQSVHVDEYLGAADSAQRIGMSHILGRLERRMRNATASGSVAQWRALFGVEG